MKEKVFSQALTDLAETCRNSQAVVRVSKEIAQELGIYDGSNGQDVSAVEICNIVFPEDMPEEMPEDMEVEEDETSASSSPKKGRPKGKKK